MSGKKILVCGATGFIGRNLVEHHAKNTNNQITAVWHKRPAYDTPDNVTWVQCDLRDETSVNALLGGQDIVIQAAATTSGSKDIVNTPFLHVTDNAVMNSLLLRAAYEQNIKHFVFFSCSVMYPSGEQPVQEADFTGELTDKYFGVGWTKVYIEKMCEFYARLGRTKHTVIRHSNIYGPYDKFDLERSHVFGASITKVMTATDRISVWGTGEERRDLLHVNDLMRFVDLALAKQESSHGLYNCGLGQSVSIKELIDAIINASGKTISVDHDLSKPTIPFNLALDRSKAESDLGWKPEIVLADGIAMTLDWWKDNIQYNGLGGLQCFV